MSWRLSAFARDERGGTAVEFGLVAPIVVSMLLAALQVALVFLARTSLETATEAAGRLVMTNQVTNGAYTQAQFKTAVCAKLTAPLQCSGVYVQLQSQASLSNVSTTPPTLSYDGAGNVTNNFNYNSGGPGNIMVLQVLYQFPVVAAPLFGWATQSNGTLLLVSTFVFENEPA